MGGDRDGAMTVRDVSVPAVVLTVYNHLGLGLVRSLGRLGIPVYCIHPDPLIPAMHSRYITEHHIWNVVESSAEENIDYLLRLGRRLGKRSVLIHTSDETATFVAENARALEEWFIFPCQRPALVSALSSKKEMHALALEHGVPTPMTIFPKTRAEVVESLGRITFPVMLKGIDGMLLERRTGVKMVIIRTRDELLAMYDRLEDPANPNLMLQEYIPGGEDSVWMFNGYFSEESDCLMAATGRKIRQAPAYTGFTSLGICLPNDTVEAMTRDFMKRIGYRGIVDIGYRYDARDGKYKVLDVNPRIGATFRLFVGRDGMDVARAAYLDLTGQDIPPARIRPGRKWFVEDRDLLSSITYYRDGRLSIGEWIRSFRGVEEAAFFSGDDLKPFFRMGVNHVKKLLTPGGRRAPHSTNSN
jgi:D-aspartate ligase